MHKKNLHKNTNNIKGTITKDGSTCRLTCENNYAYSLSMFKHLSCYNPSLGPTTKARGSKVAGQEGSLGVQESVKE